MFSFEEYFVGWVIYLASAVSLLVVFWYFTSKLPILFVKQCLRLVLATLLLVPASVENSPGYFAPAWVKAGLQFVFSGLDGFLPVGKLLLISVLLAFLVYLILLIINSLYQRTVSAAS